MCLYYPFSSHTISHKRRAMAQACAACDKVFQSSVSLDRHGPRCPKKRKDPPVANPRSQRSEGSSSRTHQRARVEPPDMDVDEPSEEPLPTHSARSGRTVRMPRCLLDYVPHGDMSLAHVPPHAPTPPEHDDRSAMPTVNETPTADQRPHPLQTVANKLGAFRRYTHTPSWQTRKEQSLTKRFCASFPILANHFRTSALPSIWPRISLTRPPSPNIMQQCWRLR